MRKRILVIDKIKMVSFSVSYMCGSSARLNFCEYAKFYVNERGLGIG